MYLKCNRRFKDGKEHRYWSLVESRRCAGGRVLQRPVLYLGEINDAQREAWIRTIEAFDEDAHCQRRLTLFASDREVPEGYADGVRVRLSEFELRRPRQWGACWLFTQLWEQLALGEFWRQKLGSSREGTDWEHVLQVLTAYRLIDPGSEWRLHRQWYNDSAMGDLLGEDAAVAEKDTLYRCLDRLVEHKRALFDHLTARWQDLFGLRFEVLLYDLTSVYFEIEPPDPEVSKRRFGYSRDKRSDCVQVVIALIVTPEGFPLAYEVLPGNTADSTTLRGFLDRIEHQYGKADRVWVCDRGIPTEEALHYMRTSDPPIRYLVGTPKGRLSKLEKELLLKPWHQARPGVQVKLLPQDGEMYVFAQSCDRIAKERSMRKRQLKKLWARLQKLATMNLTRKELLMKLGAARSQYPAAWRLLEVDVDDHDRGLRYTLSRDKLRHVRRREGRYLLRTNLTDSDPALLWRYYIQLTQVEEAFKNLKGDLSIRPIYHRNEARIEAHIFVSFLAYCLHVTLRHRLRQYAPGLTARAVLEKFASIKMVDAWFPTTDGRWLIFARYTQPEKDHRLLLSTLGLELPAQSPPRITANGKLTTSTSAA